MLIIDINLMRHRLRTGNECSATSWKVGIADGDARHFAIPNRFGIEATCTIDHQVRLAAVRRLAYEAADTGLLSPELAAGIQRVKGAKKVGVRVGNWLTVEPAVSAHPHQPP